MSFTKTPKCFIGGCEGEVTGGFQRLIAAGTTDDPHATLAGPTRAWCKEHEREVRATVSGPGKFLTEEEAHRTQL